MNDMKTSARLLALLSLLQSRRDWPGGLLADRLDVSDRTVRRDVDRLRELGYPIAAVKGPDGGYRLEAGAELPPLLFDDDQAVALAVALQLAATAGAGIDEGAARALTTLRQVMPARLRHRVDAVRVTPLGGVRPEGEQVDRDVLLAVGAAVRASEVLRFDYAAPGRTHDCSDPRLPRRAEPHHLVAQRGRWYLLAWDLERDDWRTFRLDRMTPRVPTGPRFTPREIPGGDVAGFVTALFRGSRTPADVAGGIGGWPCRGEVVVRRPVEQVVPYAADGLVEAVGPDRTRVVVGSWSWRALAAAVGGFDADFEVVGPPELVAACAELAQRFGRVQAGPGGTTPAGPGQPSTPGGPP